MHELPHDEWVVIFYPQTGATRLCPTLDFALNHLSSANMRSYVYKSPGEFRQRHDHHALEKFWRVLHKSASWGMPKTATGSIEDYDETPPDMDTESFCKALWQFMQDVGDRLSVPTVRADKSKDHYELRLGKMREAIEEGAVDETYNKQAATVFLALYNNGKQFLLEDEIKHLILGLVADRQLKTKQKPWVVFQYYRPQFIKDGYIVRGRAPKEKLRER